MDDEKDSGDLIADMQTRGWNVLFPAFTPARAMLVQAEKSTHKLGRGWLPSGTASFEGAVASLHLATKVIDGVPDPTEVEEPKDAYPYNIKDVVFHGDPSSSDAMFASIGGDLATREQLKAVLASLNESLMRGAISGAAHAEIERMRLSKEGSE